MNEATKSVACANAHELCVCGFECESYDEAEYYFTAADRVLSEAGVSDDEYQKWLKANR